LLLLALQLVALLLAFVHQYSHTLLLLVRTLHNAFRCARRCLLDLSAKNTMEANVAAESIDEEQLVSQGSQRLLQVLLKPEGFSGELYYTHLNSSSSSDATYAALAVPQQVCKLADNALMVVACREGTPYPSKLS
jgi:hypothetical protein